MEEPARRTAVTDRAQVLVTGGGPAGFAAAVSAARMGADTLLIESAGDVGGVATTGLMSHWTGNTVGGIYEEILERSRDDAPGDGPHARQVINPERLKAALLQMLRESGARLRLYTLACGAIAEDGVLRGVIGESKSGRQAFLADITVDASGDGDIAALAGAPYRKGREEDGRMQPMTLMFRVGGVDTARGVFPGAFEETFPVPLGDLQALGRERLPFPAGHVLLYRSTLPGVVTCNMTNCIDADGTDADELTRAALACREQMEAIAQFLRACVPGFENCYILDSAASIGVRETRHFIGERTLTQEDILSARQFEDWAVANAHFNFDVHNITGSGLDASGVQKRFPQPMGYTIPYGCLVPLRVENLLLAGRCISGTHLAHSSYRVMPICANMGQAAGIAAALCARTGARPRELDVGLLQRELIRAGAGPKDAGPKDMEGSV